MRLNLSFCANGIIWAVLKSFLYTDNNNNIYSQRPWTPTSFEWFGCIQYTVCDLIVTGPPFLIACVQRTRSKCKSHPHTLLNCYSISLSLQCLLHSHTKNTHSKFIPLLNYVSPFIIFLFCSFFLSLNCIYFEPKNSLKTTLSRHFRFT